MEAAPEEAAPGSAPATEEDTSLVKRMSLALGFGGAAGGGGAAAAGSASPAAPAAPTAPAAPRGWQPPGAPVGATGAQCAAFADALRAEYVRMEGPATGTFLEATEAGRALAAANGDGHLPGGALERVEDAVRGMPLDARRAALDALERSWGGAGDGGAGGGGAGAGGGDAAGAADAADAPSLFKSCQQWWERLLNAAASGGPSGEWWERPSTGPFPPELTARQLSGLRVHFDAEGLAEYEANRPAYDEIFRHASAAHAGPLQRFGQCTIIVHGAGGLYRFGRDKKMREEGVDLGDPERGIAWFGNLEYANGRAQENSLFIVNMPRAILGHPTVFIHELTHYFHSRVGFERTPALAAAFERTKAARPAIEQRYRSEYLSNPRQFEETFRNDREFFAYLMEAYHSRPPGWSAAGVVYEAGAFPRTQEALRQMDDELGLGIVAVLEETLQLDRMPEARAATRRPDPNGRILVDVGSSMRQINLSAIPQRTDHF